MSLLTQFYNCSGGSSNSDAELEYLATNIIPILGGSGQYLVGNVNVPYTNSGGSNGTPFAGSIWKVQNNPTSSLNGTYYITIGTTPRKLVGSSTLEVVWGGVFPGGGSYPSLRKVVNAQIQSGSGGTFANLTDIANCYIQSDQFSFPASFSVLGAQLTADSVNNFLVGQATKSQLSTNPMAVDFSGGTSAGTSALTAAATTALTSLTTAGFTITLNP